MKYIINESQEKKIFNSENIDRNAKIVSQVFNAVYNYVLSYEDRFNEVYVLDYNNSGGEDLLMYWDYKQQNFYVGVHFLDKLHYTLNVPFLDYYEVKDNKREMFDEIFKLFALYEFGFRPNKIYFHWY